MANEDEVPAGEGGLLDDLLDAAAAATPEGVGMILADTGVALDFARRIRDAHQGRPEDEG